MYDLISVIDFDQDCGSRMPALELVSAVELLLQDLNDYGSRVPALDLIFAVGSLP